MNNLKRGVIYARYSAGPHQTEQSIEGQLRECRQYAERNGITIIREYIDRKISGTTDNREQFLLMMEDSKRHQFDVVITYKTDRFSRNRYDAAVYKRQLRLNGVEIAYSSESIPDGPEGIILESLLEGLAEYYSAELRQKIARGMHESALKGKALGPMLMGYRKGKDGRYEINPSEAKVVRYIFEKYVSGAKIKDIAQDAYAMGLRTKFGSPVSATRIADMLGNEKYIGIYNARGVRIVDGMPAIIDKETFYRAQKRKDYSRHHRGENYRKSNCTVDYLLSGKAFCGSCGEPFVGYSGTSQDGSIFYYYVCRGKRNKTCSRRYIPKYVLEKTVAQITVQRVLQSDVIFAIIDSFLQLTECKEAYASKRRQISKAIRKTENEIENICSAIASGFVSDSLKAKLRNLETEKTRLNTELCEYRDKPKLTRQQLEFLFLQAKQADEEDEDKYRKRLLDLFVKSVLVFDDKVVVTYNLQGNPSESVLTVKDFSGIERYFRTEGACSCSALQKCSPSEKRGTKYLSFSFLYRIRSAVATVRGTVAQTSPQTGLFLCFRILYRP